MVALARRAREGGSWLVRVSLAQTGRWIDTLGRIEGAEAPEQRLEDIVAPAARLSETPARRARPTVLLGTDAPIWADA